MTSKIQRVPLKIINRSTPRMGVDSRESKLPSTFTKEKPRDAMDGQKTRSKQTDKNKITPVTVNKSQQRPSTAMKKEVPYIIRKKTGPVRVQPTIKNRALTTKTKPEEKTDVNPSNLQPTFSMDLPKLRTIIDNMTSFVKIDHEKVYPLLEIFIDYIEESLPGRIRKNSLTSEDLEGLPKDLHEKIQRFEKQKIMDPLISPGVDLENKTDYEDNFMKLKLSNLLPILRKCNGDINFIDKNGQTILHIFIRRYVITHKILQEEDLIKLEYQNSPQLHFRQATFHVIYTLLEKGASVNISDLQGNTPLHTLCKFEGYEEIIKVLLENFSDVDSSDINGNTVLHLMLETKLIDEKNLQNIITLIFKNADIHKRNNEGKAPIHIAIENCQIETFSIFEKKAADFQLKTKDNKTSLHLVCKSTSRDDTKKIKTINFLITKGIDINAVDKEGYSALHYAVKFSSRKIIKLLITLNANIYCQTKSMNFTPIHLASQFGCPSAINTLIEAGMNVNILATGGLIPLHLAILHSDPLIVECLIINGADVNCRDTIFGFTPAHLTAFVCRKKLELLIKKGSDVNARNRMGITSLHLASMLGNVEIVEALCENGAEVNCRDNLFSMTPLHWASMKGTRLNLNRIINGTEDSEDEHVISEFWKPFFLKFCQNCENHDNIDAHPSTNVSTMFKGTPSVSTIVLQPKSEVMKILLKFGAHSDMQDNEGRLVVHNVIKSDNVEGMKYLLEYGWDFNDIETSNRVINTWNSVKVRSYVLWNAMKLRVAELPIAEVYVSKIVKPRFQKEFDYEKNEALKLKKYVIDGEVTVYMFLRMEIKERFDYVNRVMEMLFDLEMNFPDYYGIILASCRQAVARINLEEEANLTLIKLTNRDLTDIWYERFFPRLRSIDLRAFVDAVLKVLKNE